MGMVSAIRLMNAATSGTLSGADLETELTTGDRLGEWQQLLALPGQCRILAASSTAMAAVAASSTAMAAVAASSTAMAAVAASSTARDAINASPTALAAVEASTSGLVAWITVPAGLTPADYADMAAVAASSTAMAAVAASSTAMAAVWASNTASDAVLTSSTAKLAVYESDTALAALQANPTQVARQISIGGRTTTATNNWGGAFNFVENGTKVILLRRWYGSGSEFDYINWARGSTTTGSGHGPVAGSGGRTLYTGSQALGCVSGSYTSTGSSPTTNDDTANFVCAANGLRRNSSAAGGNMSVTYITV